MSHSAPKLIYFIKPVGMDGPIKIGCSYAPKRRIEDLSVWSPFPLEILATADGGYDVERKLHQRFAYAHSHREWFNPVPELTAAVHDIARGIAIEVAVDLSINTGSIRRVTHNVRPVPEYRVGLRSYSSRVLWAEKKLRAKDEYDAWCTPPDVLAILKRWDGKPYLGTEGVRPSEAEFRRLDEYLADPAAHSVVPRWRKQAA